MGWADSYRRLQVRTNADTPHDAAQARKFGAQGIGLCRTEHMFFEGDRIRAIRRMICSDTVEQREAALAVLEPMQQGDFEGIYEAMEGCPVTIRFLDPPLHEFVPTEEADIEKLAEDLGKPVADIKNIIASLHEFNPMMGHRGCRLAVTYPEIAAMQTRAVIKAALAVQAKHPGWNMVPEIMIPLVGEVKELKYVKDVVTKTADEIIKAAGSDMKYLVGTMIEIPRAALTADEIAASWWTWPASWAAPPTPTCIWASAASMAATPPRWSSATGRVWTMCPALLSACPLPVWPPHRPLLRTQGTELCLFPGNESETPPMFMDGVSLTLLAVGCTALAKSGCGDTENRSPPFFRKVRAPELVNFNFSFGASNEYNP